MTSALAVASRGTQVRSSYDYNIEPTFQKACRQFHDRWLDIHHALQPCCGVLEPNYSHRLRAIRVYFDVHTTYYSDATPSNCPHAARPANEKSRLPKATADTCLVLASRVFHIERFPPKDTSSRKKESRGHTSGSERALSFPFASLTVDKQVYSPWSPYPNLRSIRER